jgi:hypothetical protein
MEFFRSSSRGWFTFGHLCFRLLFFFGHLWHGARTIFRNVFAGIDPELDDQIEFGSFQKLGDTESRRESILKLLLSYGSYCLYIFASRHFGSYFFCHFFS